MIYPLSFGFTRSVISVATIAFFAALVTGPVARCLGPRLGAMDRPKPLSIHTRPTPRTGGLAVLAGFLPAVGCGGFSAICGFVTLLA